MHFHYPKECIPNPKMRKGKKIKKRGLNYLFDKYNINNCSPLQMQGADTITMPNIVMNSLVSPTKVVTNDSIPNPIISTHHAISLPSIPVPVTSIGIPILNMKCGNKNDIDESLGLNKATVFTVAHDTERIDIEDEKTIESESKKNSVEPMPIEDDLTIEMSSKIEENLDASDIEVTEAIETELDSSEQILKIDDALVMEPPLNKIYNLNTNNEHLNSMEPMECASVNSMASPKHIIATDIVMAESISVSYKLKRLMRMAINLFVNAFVFLCRLRRQGACKWRAQILR